MSEIICFILAFIAGLIVGNIFGEKLKLQRNRLKQEIEMMKLQLEAYQKPKKPTLGEKLEELLPNVDGETLGAVLDDMLPSCSEIDYLNLEEDV